MRLSAVSRRPIALLVLPLLALALLAGLAASASAARCIQNQLPRLDSDAAAEGRALIESGEWLATRAGDRTPPPNPQVGDTWLWYVWDLSGFPVANLKPCTVRGMGDNCYVVVDDDEWNVGMDQADVDRIVDHFENQSVGNFPGQGIWDLNTSHFGDPPNPLDNLDRVFLFYYRFNIASDGFFWVFDQFPDGSQAWASNETDVIYLAVDNGNPAGDYMLAVAAHEFEHLIHYARDTNEDSWLDEGLGELAMWLFGNPDNISAFNTNADNNLIVFDGNWADYIQTYLWSLYNYEQYGGQPLIWDLVHDPANGMASYLNAVNGQGFPVTMEDVFGEWAVANYLDDTSVPDGQYGYLGDDLPPFNPWVTHNSYPVSNTGLVQGWATDYVRMQNLGGAPIVSFNGTNTRAYRITLMGIDPGMPTIVEEMTLDAANDGSLTFTAAMGYSQVIMTVASVHAAAGGYSYEIDEAATAAPATPAMQTRLAAHPNPFNPKTALRFSLADAGLAELDLLDTSGRSLRRLLAAELPAGEHAIEWEADGLPSGVYLARLRVDGRKAAEVKLTLLK